MKATFLFLFLLMASFAHAEPPTEPTAEEAVTTEAPATEEAKADTEVDADAKADTPEAKTEDDTTPATDAEAIETANALLEAINSKNWTLVFGFGVMLLVYIFRKFGLMKKVPDNAIVWVGVAIGALVTIAAALIDGAELQPAIMQGVIIGLSGAGLWTAAGKHALPGIKAPEAPVEAPVESPEDKA